MGNKKGPLIAFAALILALAAFGQQIPPDAIVDAPYLVSTPVFTGYAKSLNADTGTIVLMPTFEYRMLALKDDRGTTVTVKKLNPIYQVDPTTGAITVKPTPEPPVLATPIATPAPTPTATPIKP